MGDLYHGRNPRVAAESRACGGTSAERVQQRPASNAARLEPVLVNRAHSFILQARLAISLAWVAGYVNVVALITCGTMVSHLTGHGTMLGREVVDGSWWPAALTTALFAAFFGGAFASGFAIELARQRGWSSIYVLPAALELLLLAVFALGVRLHDPAQLEHGARLWWMTVVATVAMGVQNATITRISSGVVRTTHLTGIVTDLGHESAQLAVVRWMFGRREADPRPDARGPSFQRLLLLAGILGAFIAGGAGGALVYREFPQWSMLAPVALLAWIIVQDVRTPICEIEEARLADCSEVFGDARPASADVRGVGDVVVFRVIPRGGGREAHLPDLAAWLESLPAEKRVVILDLGRVRAFGPLAAGALAAMSVAAGRLGRRVVVAGLDAGEIATINALSRADLLNERNSAPDLGSALRVAAEAAADALAEERTTARRPTSDAARPRG